MQTTAPRSGILGYWDQFVGPDMSRQELAFVIAASTAGAVVTSALALTGGFQWFVVLAGAFIGLDLVGGAVCNMTQTTKAWYHREDQTFWNHFSFIAVHIAHVALFAACFRGADFDWSFFLLTSSLLLGSALLTLRTPQTFRLPMSVLCLSVSLFAVDVLPPSTLFDWFVPLMYIKLLVGHAVGPTPKAKVA